MSTITKNNPFEHASVTTYLMVNKTDELIDFLNKLFGATLIECHRDDNHQIIHAEIQMGDTIVMIAEAEGHVQSGAFYVYVEDVDKVFTHAQELGATTLSEPADQEYGARVARIQDSHGNVWALAKQFQMPEA